MQTFVLARILPTLAMHISSPKPVEQALHPIASHFEWESQVSDELHAYRLTQMSDVMTNIDIMC